MLKKLKRNNGFTLIELLTAIAVLGIIVVMIMLMSRGTFSTANTQLEQIRLNEIRSISEVYVADKGISSWILNDNYEFVCVNVIDIINEGYFKENEMDDFKDKQIKVIRDNITKVIDNVEIVDKCN